MATLRQSAIHKFVIPDPPPFLSFVRSLASVVLCPRPDCQGNLGPLSVAHSLGSASWILGFRSLAWPERFS